MSPDVGEVTERLSEYADDIDIIARTPKAMLKVFNNLEKAAKNMNLHINEEKTRYMPVTQKHYVNRPAYLEIGS